MVPFTFPGGAPGAGFIIFPVPAPANGSQPPKIFVATFFDRELPRSITNAPIPMDPASLVNNPPPQNPLLPQQQQVPQANSAGLMQQIYQLQQHQAAARHQQQMAAAVVGMGPNAQQQQQQQSHPGQPIMAGATTANALQFNTGVRSASSGGMFNLAIPGGAASHLQQQQLRQQQALFGPGGPMRQFNFPGAGVPGTHPPQPGHPQSQTGGGLLPSHTPIVGGIPNLGQGSIDPFHPMQNGGGR